MEDCHFSTDKRGKIGCKEKEMAAVAKYMEGCQIVAEMAMRNTKNLASFEQLNQNDCKPGKMRRL